MWASVSSAPKAVLVRDSGLLHSLMGIRDQEAPLGHPVVGSSSEGMVNENIWGTVLTNTQSRLYRTSVWSLRLTRPWNRANPAVGNRDQAFTQRSEAE